MFLFQIPRLPEQTLLSDRFGVLARALRDEPTQRGVVTEADLARYREAWSQPGALTAMLNWYRAMVRPHAAVRITTIAAPTLVLWGDEDPHLSLTLAPPPEELVPNARVRILPGASHWVQHDAAREVNAALCDFLRRERRERRERRAARSRAAAAPNARPNTSSTRSSA
jgi:pimeloyl-ACP methyl ester carboxylesterase